MRGKGVQAVIISKGEACNEKRGRNSTAIARVQTVIISKGQAVIISKKQTRHGTSFVCPRIAVLKHCLAKM